MLRHVAICIVFIIFLSVIDVAPTTNGAPPPDECLSTNKPTAQIDVEVVGTSESSFAVDKDLSTHSCTQDNEAYPWWAVDLEEEYDVGSLDITLPAINGDNLNGLNNFRVGFPSAMPAEGSAVDRNSYLVCGELEEGVEIGEVITINCAASTDNYRYVIIQSLDTRAEKMCIAEACIKLRVVTTVEHHHVAVTSTPTPTDCLSTGKDAIQISDEIEAGSAVDGLITTFSCTLNTRSWPWWVVDLGKATYVSKVTVTLPNVGGDNLNGLNNFQVVFPSSLPAVGSEVATDAYPVCGAKTVGVDVGLELTIDCAASTEQYQYVMIQSVDTSAEKLCIAEVCVYTAIVTTPALSEALTTTPTPTAANGSLSTTPLLTSAPGSTDQLLLGLFLGIGTAIIICVIILLICCCWHPCPLYGRCHKKAARQRRDESATVNSQPLSEIIGREATTTYEPLDVRTMMAERPISYEHPVLPSETEENYQGLVLPHQTAERHNTYDADGYVTVIG